MIQTRSLKIAVFALCLVLTPSLAATAQQAADTNYDVVLELVVGSNDAAAKNDIPQNLSSVVKQIKSDFNFSSYRLASTFVGRVANGGYFDYNSVTNINGQESTKDSQTFLDWSLKNLHTLPASKGLQAESFRFGARVPVVVGVHDAGSDKERPVINYEQLGINLIHVGINANVPTMVGTLHLPGTSGTIFLVMTIRPTES